MRNTVQKWPYLLSLYLLLTCGFSFAQDQEFFTGQLVDANSEEPVVFASIRIKDRALGVISNSDGSFRIPMKYKEYGDIIEISSMGYQTKEISITEFKSGELNSIKLEPGAIDLQEAIVKGKDKSKQRLTARQIVQKAIDAIPRNYPSTSFSTVGYYRDYQLKEASYINLNEGILEVFDQGFDQLDDGTSKIRLFNFGLNKDFQQDSMAKTAYDYVSNRKIINKAYLDAYGGNEFRILRIHDAIRNYSVGSYDFVGRLRTDLTKNHRFLRSNDTNSDNEQLYNIKFKVIKVNYIANGNIYISKADFAIHKLEYTMYNGSKRNKERKKNKHGHRQKVIFNVLADYKKFDSKMYLNYISFQNNFEVRKPPKFVLDSTLINAPEAFLMLYFNKPVDSISAKTSKNYDVIFKNRKFEIKTIEVLQNAVKLRMDENFMKTMGIYRGELSARVRKYKRTEQKELFDVQVKNIRDVDNNLLNESEIEEYDQYREFFVQRVKPDSRAPLDSLFVDKRKPIFEDQPMTKPKDYKEYWMNTPLQKRQ